MKVLKVVCIFCLLMALVRAEGLELQTRRLEVTGSYLHLPIRNVTEGESVDRVLFGKAAKEPERLHVSVDGILQHNVSVILARTEAEISWWAYLYIGDIEKGRVLTLQKLLPKDSRGMQLIKMSDQLPVAGKAYDETWRPQLHFTAYRGWNNDSNGMIYYNGQYHLFYQSNPVAIEWDNMYWGHAVSDDMLHWKQLPEKLRPNGGLWLEAGGRVHSSMARGHCHSGSGAVDEDNLLGLQENENKTLLAYFTDTGTHGSWRPFEALAYSVDGGHRWIYWKENPVINHKGRDPKVLYHKASGHWILVAYDEEEGHKDTPHHGFAFYRSKDLKNWERTCLIKGFYECPEFFSLPVDGDPSKTKWVLYDGKGRYLVGDFDGHTFTPLEPDNFSRVHYGAGTGQCFSNQPEGRQIYIGCYWQHWEKTPKSCFQNSMSLPFEMVLRTTPKGIRLFGEPIREIESLRGELMVSESALKAPAGKSLVIEEVLKGELADIEIVIENKDSKARSLRLQYRGGGMQLDFENNRLGDKQVDIEWGDEIRIRLIIDRPFSALTLNGGERTERLVRSKPGALGTLKMELDGGTLEDLKVYTMNSIYGP
jgi:fructan beta-fructosidase